VVKREAAPKEDESMLLTRLIVCSFLLAALACPVAGDEKKSDPEPAKQPLVGRWSRGDVRNGHELEFRAGKSGQLDATLSTFRPDGKGFESVPLNRFTTRAAKDGGKQYFDAGKTKAFFTVEDGYLTISSGELETKGGKFALSGKWGEVLSKGKTKGKSP
jgi:hypothetical protein